MPVAGTYTISINPSGAGTGNVTLTLYTVPADAAGTINPDGTPVSISTTTPGQNAVLSFTPVTGQRVSLLVSNVTIPGGGFLCGGTVTIRDQNGNPVSSTSSANTCSDRSTFIDTQALVNPGATYTIFVDPNNENIGSVTLTLNNVPPDLQPSIAPGGSAVTVSINAQGQNAVLPFIGNAGDRVSLLMSNVTIANSDVTIINPDGTTLATLNGVGTSGGFIDVQRLPVTVTAADVPYKIKVNPSGTNTGNMTLTLYSVPNDVTGSITVGGVAVGVTTTTPGQNGRLTFSITQSQQVTVHLTNNTMGTVKVALIGTDGITTVTSAQSNSSSFNLTTQTLAPGTYTISIDPIGASTGSITVSVTSP